MSEIRFWYTGNIGHAWVCGWCFGSTIDEAGASALRYEAKNGRKTGAVKLFLQADNGPDAGFSVAWIPRDAAKPGHVDVVAGGATIRLFAWEKHAFTGGVFVGVDEAGVIWRCPMLADGTADVAHVDRAGDEDSMACLWQTCARIFLAMAHGHELGPVAAVVRAVLRPAAAA